jgi:hypothetical protein
MKELPILFKGPMVRAIIEGRKTQTRRVVKPQPILLHGGSVVEWRLKKDAIERFAVDMASAVMVPFSRYKVGMRLWVRETWAEEYNMGRWTGVYLYRECDEAIDIEHRTDWRPSIHMPRWASRLSLEVTEVRCERLQDISEEDAIAEGVGHGFQMNGGWPDYEHIKSGVCELSQDTAQMSFATLWDSINRKKYPWDANPWVWVITFRKV